MVDVVPAGTTGGGEELDEEDTADFTEEGVVREGPVLAYRRMEDNL